MNHRFRDWPDSDNPHMRHDAVTYKLREPSLMREYEATKDLVATHVAGLLPGLDLAGQWSLDLMRDGSSTWRPPNAAPSTNRRCRKGSVGR